MHTALDLYEEIGVGWAVATVGGNMAMIAERQGDIDAAIQFAERARLAARPLRLGAYDAMMLARLGDYALWKGDRAGADEYHRRAVEMADEVGYPIARAVALAGQAVAHRQAGELDAAERDAETALAMLRSSGLWNGVPKMLATLGMIAEQRGNFDEARELHHRALRASRSATDGRAAALALEGLASLALVNGDRIGRPGCWAGPPSSGARAAVSPVGPHPTSSGSRHRRTPNSARQRSTARSPRRRGTARGTRRRLTAR